MLIYIKPLSTFPNLHSDTLFGAITSAVSELYPDIVEEMINEFNDGRPPFILSSAFPYIYNNEIKVKFYPKIIFDNDFSDIDTEIIKKYKKIDFYDEKIFFNLINGNITEFDLINNFDDYIISESKKFLMSKDYKINYKMSRNIIPNNSINRITTESEVIFYSEGYTYVNSGLYFILRFFDESYVNIIKNVFKFLKDRGFGKDISTGKGRFDYEISDEFITELNNDEGNSFVSLSRFIPSLDDLKRIGSFSAYEIVSKRGRHASNDIRKEIKFFKEGSTFSNYQFTYGKIVDSGNKYPAIEYGYAFPIMFNMGDF